MPGDRGTTRLDEPVGRQCGTSDYKFDKKLFLECLKVGIPNAIFFVCEVLAFAAFYAMMQGMGVNYLTVVGICQNMWILFSFFAEGINKATATVVGNLIGAGKAILIPNVIKAGVKLNLIFLIVLLSAFTFGNSFIIEQFLPMSEPQFVESIRGSLEICLYFMAIYMFFEGLRFQFAGVLTAAGDTYFLFVAGSTLVWAFMVLPVYFLVVKMGNSVETAFSLWIVYSIVSCIAYYSRTLLCRWNSLVTSKL